MERSGEKPSRKQAFSWRLLVARLRPCGRIVAGVSGYGRTQARPGGLRPALPPTRKSFENLLALAAGALLREKIPPIGCVFVADLQPGSPRPQKFGFPSVLETEGEARQNRGLVRARKIPEQSGSGYKVSAPAPACRGQSKNGLKPSLSAVKKQKSRLKTEKTDRQSRGFAYTGGGEGVLLPRLWRTMPLYP